MNTRDFRFVLAVLAVVACAGRASATPMNASMSYQTVGVVGLDAAGAPTNPIQFNGISNGAMTTSAPFSLGDFEISSLPNGFGTQGINLPFTIIFSIKSIDGLVPKINETPILIKGWISGTLSETGQSQLNASFDLGPQFSYPKYFNPRVAPPFQTGDLMNTLNLVSSSELIALSPTTGGRTPIEARLDATPIPEPTSFLVFLFPLIGYILSHRYQYDHKRKTTLQSDASLILQR